MLNGGFLVDRLVTCQVAKWVERLIFVIVFTSFYRALVYYFSSPATLMAFLIYQPTSIVSALLL